MRPFGRWARSSHPWVVMLAAAAGCTRDDRTVTVPVGSVAVANAAVASDSAWDTLVADVTIVPTRVDTAGRHRKYPATQYHLERSRQPNGWSTVLTFAPRNRARTRPGTTPFDPEAVEATRIETDEHGSIRIFNGHGDEIREPDRASIAALMKRIVPDTVVPNPKIRRGTPSQSQLRPASGWVQEYLAATSDAPRRTTGIEKHWGSRKSVKGALAIYQHDDAKAHRKLDLDQATGLTSHMLITRGDSVRQSIDYVYDQTPDGSIVHRSTHSEVTHGKWSSITDITYSNIHLEKRGTRP